MRISLKAKLVSFILFIVIACSVSIGIITSRLIQKYMKATVYKTLDTLADDVTKQIQLMNEAEFDFLHSIARLPQIKDPSIDVKDKFDILVEIAKGNTNKYEDICFADLNGLGYTSAGTYRDFSNASWVKGAIAKGDFIRDPSFSSRDNKILMFYSVKVYDDKNNFVGVLGSILKGDRLVNVLKEIDVGGGIHPFIISRENKTVIADANIYKTEIKSNKIEELGLAEDIMKPMMAAAEGKTGNGIFISPDDGGSMTYSYNPISGNGQWAVFCMAPYDVYFGSISIINRTMVAGLLIACILAAVIGFVAVFILIKPLNRVKNSITEIASGNADLTKRIDNPGNDEIGDVVRGFNTFTGKLQSIISEVKNSKTQLINAGEDLGASTQDTSASIKQIITNIESVHNQIKNQTSSVDLTAKSVNEISLSISALENMIESQSSGVTEASAAVEEMIGNIASVNQSVDKMAQSFEQLQTQAQMGADKQSGVNERIEKIENQSEMLQEANTAIAAIAEQTNLLAMNAAIEAAHAGDAGKGFSVVADEIRKLSETSSQQSKTIGNQLNEIKESIESVVQASAESSQAFSNVSEMIRQTDQLVRQIKAAMEEQNEGSRQITAVLHSMNDSTVEVRKASSAMNEGNKEILMEIQRLQDVTQSMNSSMEEMSIGAGKINETGAALSDISKNLSISIDDIGAQIDQFKV